MMPAKLCKSTLKTGSNISKLPKSWKLGQLAALKGYTKSDQQMSYLTLPRLLGSGSRDAATELQALYRSNLTASLSGSTSPPGSVPSCLICDVPSILRNSKTADIPLAGTREVVQQAGLHRSRYR